MLILFIRTDYITHPTSNVETKNLKTLLFIALSAFALSISAVPTSQCPRVLEVSLQSFDLNYPETIATDASEELRAAAVETRDKLERLGRLKVKYVLKFAGGQKCYYEGRNQAGHYYRAKLENTQGNTETPYKLVNKNGTIAVIIPITAVRRSGLSVLSEKPQVRLFHYQKSCQGPTCPTNFTSLGQGTLRFVR